MNKKVLPILFSTLLLDTISIGILIPILPSVFTDSTSATFILHGYSQGMQYFIAGAITAVFGLMQFIASPILGELSDVYGRKRLLTLGVALLAVSNLFFGFGISIASLGVLFVARIVAGLAGANFSIAQATIADVTLPADRAKNFGLIGAAFGIGFILGPLLGGFIASTFNLASAPFLFAGMLGIINVVFISLFLPETRKVENKVLAKFNIFKGISNIKIAAKDKQASPIYLTSFLYMSGFAFFTSFINILFTKQYSFTERDIGIYFALLGVCIAVTQIFILRIVTKKYSEKKIMLTGYPIVASCFLVYPFIQNPIFFYFLVPIYAIPQGLAFANMSSLISKSVSSDKQGAALGINGSLMALAQGLAPIIAGIGTGFIGLKLPFITASVFIMSAWFVLRSTRKVSS
jgi:DHA1 family tetracycline resistance protein-like MFS transporter